jgi:hypothetical protein
MDSDLEFGLTVRAWLHSEPADPAERVVDDVVALLDGHPQRRAISRRTFRPRGRLTMAGIAIAAVFVVVAVAVELIPESGRLGAVGSPSTSPGPRTTPPLSSAGTDDGTLLRGSTALGEAGIRFSFKVPPGWEGFGPENPDYISKSVRGPQGAEGQIVWAAFPTFRDSPGECAYLRAYERSDGFDPSVAGLANAAASVPGTDLLSGPTATTVGGLAALHVVLQVRDDVGCDPGFFFVYPNIHGGALWPETEPGDTVRVWIVDTPERLLFIEAKTKPDAGPRLESEIQAIIDSVAFE